MKIRDAFKILNISEDASPEEIKKAYRQKVKQFHPDVNSSDNAQSEFEFIQSAYTLIQAYLQYKESEYTDEPSLQKSKRKKRYTQSKAAKKQWFDARIQYDISVFKHSKKFILSRIIAILGCIISFGICIDHFSVPIDNYKPIQHIKVPANFNEIENYAWKDVYIIAQNRNISVSPLQLELLQKTTYLKISNTPFLQQIIQIQTTNTQPYTNIDFYNFYNDAFWVIVILLCGGMSMYVFRTKSVGYYSIIRFYNLYCIPLVIVFVLFGEARILRLIGVI
ncbi:MAG TPA: J domain-containing protein [Bacteroidales bacterium]|nr:MAG: Chaperone protein DnaJ [Bacteroidetes bacterium ADurb.Bin217]HOS83437.1 J domain-containing protein [Bacteroidales bacterium]HPH15901.1 J domain-containing protein [Bacteroidales bacterium]HPM12066.1 J domain-containing protein [Bacteroidales bacterium]